MSRASDLSPISSILGQRGERLLALTGWVQEMSDGTDAAHLLLAPLGHGVADKMRKLAGALGLGEGDVMPDVPPDITHVQLDDTDVVVHYGNGALLARPVDAEWTAAARGRGVIALWVGRDGAVLVTLSDMDRYQKSQARRARLHGGLVRLITLPDQM